MSKLTDRQKIDFYIRQDKTRLFGIAGTFIMIGFFVRGHVTADQYPMLLAAMAIIWCIAFLQALRRFRW